MSDLQELKQKTIKYVPEIMELKRGCRINLKYSGEAIFIDTEEYYTTSFILKNNLINTTTEEYKIIGRDITLEDVLIALEYCKEFIAIDTRGDFINNIDGFSIGIRWDLGKTLDEQSEETIKILNKIIK